MSKPYIIVTPQFEITSGGIRVMYGLYGWLLAKGQVAFLNQSVNVPAIGVYPEIVHGNPANTETVVRYILNKPGVMASHGVSGPTSFDPSDVLYVFSQMFNTLGVNQDKIFFLPILDLHIFKDQGVKRTKSAYFVGKGVNRELHPKDSISIDRTLAQDQQALADLLNECQVLYSYDPVSAMTEIARLCGCRVQLLQDVYTKQDYKNYEAGLNGISFGLDEETPLDTDGFREHYKHLRQDFSRALDRFIDYTQSA